MSNEIHLCAITKATSLACTHQSHRGSAPLQIGHNGNVLETHETCYAEYNRIKHYLDNRKRISKRMISRSKIAATPISCLGLIRL